MAADKPRESLVGQTIDKCRILGKLGTGGMGSVYLAEHFGLNRKVAVKILPGDMSRDPEYVARFMREATTAGKLEHPNIVQIHDVGYADSHHYIIMQFVDGESLSTVVDNLGALEPRDAAKVASGILRGLHHAHEAGVVHRDIKPDNVLIAKGDQPKLLDFGLAIETEASLHITKDGMVVGTPYYLSPEQARGHAATPQSDVYATGVTFYYLLTGKRPFTGATALAVLNKHINDAPVPPMTHRPTIPRTINDIVLKMMAKQTADRYKTAAAAADDLDRFLKGEEVEDVLTWQMRLRGLTSRQKLVGAGAGGAVLLLLLILLIVALVPEKEPVPPPLPPPAAVIKENRALQELLAFERANRDSLDQHAEITGRFNDYLGANSDPALVRPAQEKLDEYRKHAGQIALQLFQRLPPASDPLARLQALEGLPRGVLAIKAAADRAAEERGRLLPLLEQRYAESRSKLDRALSSGEFDDARALIAELLRFVAGERRAEVERIRKELPEIEAGFRDPLLQAYGPVRAEFEQLLVRRQILKAYARVASWVNQLDATGVRRARLPGVNYGMLLRVQENTVLEDAVLSDFRSEIGGVWTQAQDTLAFRVLSDLQDALDLEWLLRRAGRALQALEQKRLEVTLATFGGAGKVGFGPGGFAFAPRSGPEKPFTVGALVPADLTALAAVADGITPDEAFASSKAIVRAGGAAWYYSRTPERWPASVRWTAQAAALRAPGPPGRLRDLRDAGAQEVRRKLLETSKEKFEAARKILDTLGAQWAHDPELSAEVSRSTAALLAAEFVRSTVAVQVALGRELREKHAGRYDAALVDPLYARALESSGRWDFVTPNLADAAWTWDGKDTGAPAPAAVEEGLGFRPVPGRRLELTPARLRGASGLMFSVRLNEKKAAFFAGVELEGAKEGVRWRLGLREPGRLVLLDADGTELRSAPLEGFRPGRFTDLSFIAVGGELFCYADKKPLFDVRGGVRLDRPVAFSADAPVNIRGIELRK